VWASGGVASGGAEVVQVIGVKGVSRNELETCRLESTGVREENTLSECWEDR